MYTIFHKDKPLASQLHLHDHTLEFIDNIRFLVMIFDKKTHMGKAPHIPKKDMSKWIRPT